MNLQCTPLGGLKRSPSFLGPIPPSHDGLLHKLLEQVRANHHDKQDTAAAGEDANAAPPSMEAEEVDVVVSGGGFKGYFVTGAFAVLSGLRSLRVARIAGASAGAWCAVYMTCGVDPVTWADTYYASRVCVREGLSIADSFRRAAHELLPPDAHVRCSGVVHISISVVTWRGIKNLIVSQFTSNDDLIDATLSSCAIPFMTTHGFGQKFRGMHVLDGGVSLNTPVFTDGLRRQIVFQLTDIAYPMSMSLSTTDSCIESLILRGAISMGRFLDAGPAVIDCIKWYDGRGTMLAPAAPTTPHSGLSTSSEKAGVSAAGTLRRALSAVAALLRILLRFVRAACVISKRAAVVAWVCIMSFLRWVMSLVGLRPAPPSLHLLTASEV